MKQMMPGLLTILFKNIVNTNTYTSKKVLAILLSIPAVKSMAYTFINTFHTSTSFL